MKIGREIASLGVVIGRLFQCSKWAMACSLLGQLKVRPDGQLDGQTQGFIGEEYISHMVWCIGYVYQADSIYENRIL